MKNPFTGSPVDTSDDGSALESVNDAPAEVEGTNDLTSVMALRKNLMVSFEKQDGDQDAKSKKVSNNPKNSRPPMMPNNHGATNQKTIADASAHSEPRGIKRCSSVASIDTHNTQESQAAAPALSNRLMSVYLRIRPLPSKIIPGTEPQTMEVMEDDITSAQYPTRVRTYPPPTSQAFKSIRQSSDTGSSKNVVVAGVKEFQFNRIFPQQTSQKDIYHYIAAPLVKGLFAGQSALLFAFGNTNAGKTYTVLGSAQSRDERKCGIIPRALRDIIDGMKQRSVGDYNQLQISFFEIYNEQVLDLLAIEDESLTSLRKRSFVENPSLKVREGKDGQIFVQGLTKHNITSVSQGVKLILAGTNKRQTASNSLNGESSRSHCIFQIELMSENKNKDSKSVAMWIVDLAGSERSKRTGNVSRSKLQREAATINVSLMNLMQCIQQLSHNQNRSGTNVGVVPFRSSKLSHLFMNHLTSSSSGRTAMIVNVNPSSEDFDETQHVLSYAAVARNVKVHSREYHKRIKVENVEPKTGSESEVDKKISKLHKPTKEKKVARLKKMLSPKAFRSKKVPPTKLPETQPLLTHSASPASQISAQEVCLVAVPEPDCVKSRSDFEQENAGLKLKLVQAEEEKAKLREMIEEEIREEVAAEFEEHVTKLRKHYEENLVKARAKEGDGTLDNFLEQSAKKVQRDKHEQYLEELQDTIEECEEEMERMRVSHENALKSLKNQHEEEMERLKRLLDEKDCIILSLNNEGHQAILSSRTSDKDDNYIAYADESHDFEDEEEKGEIFSAGSDGENSSIDQENKENAVHRIRLLRHVRASEVACELP